jgi:hypothetical protein
MTFIVLFVGVPLHTQTDINPGMERRMEAFVEGLILAHTRLPFPFSLRLPLKVESLPVLRT